MRSRVSHALVALAALPLLLGGCGDTGGSRAGGGEAGAGDTESPEQVQVTGREATDAFLRIQAEHVCEVQSRVYEDAEALAEAYDSVPDFPGLSDADVSRLQDRLERDGEFSDELNDRVARVCG